MSIEVKYFGVIAEITGKTVETIDIKGMENTDAVRLKLTSDYPNLATVSFEIALDQIIILDSQKITEDSEIALLPPFAGG